MKMIYKIKIFKNQEIYQLKLNKENKVINHKSLLAKLKLKKKNLFH